jgi:pilus assembly protein Flp/PilA
VERIRRARYISKARRFAIAGISTKRRALTRRNGMPLAQIRSLHARLYSEEGQALVEYALILSLIAIVLLGALGLVSGRIGSLFTRIGTSL